MMLFKTFLSLLLFTAIGSITIAGSDKFPVIYVNGKVVYTNTNKLIKPGDKITPKSRLQFDSEDAFLLTIIEEHVVKLSQHNYKQDTPDFGNEFSCSRFIYATVTDSAFFYPLNVQTDTFQFFKPNRHISIDKRNFQLKDNNFLIIQFESPNNSFSRKISFSGENIVLDKPSLFKKDTSIHSSKIKILHYNSNQDSYQHLYSYHPYIISKDETEKIIHSIHILLIKLFSDKSGLIEQYEEEAMLELVGICSKGEIR